MQLLGLVYKYWRASHIPTESCKSEYMQNRSMISTTNKSLMFYSSGGICLDFNHCLNKGNKIMLIFLYFYSDDIQQVYLSIFYR